MLAWEVVQAMDDASVNRALEQLAGRTWERLTTLQGATWVHWSAEGVPTYSTVPHLHSTASWGVCMDLAWAAGISWHTETDPATGHTTRRVYLSAHSDVFGHASTPEAMRGLLCRLALYAAEHVRTPREESL